ncbi:MAG: acylneuraminate cytidylyltransferase family protein [Candidatus Omnitrophica bacterium]|nr:acylneuraminate cytidylyltransferase family protein [Candidatus Omnitrophota bacterium]
MSKVIAIIPARSGSKGVPNKNLKILGGFPLIAYSIAASALSKGIQRTLVSTDSPEIRDMAKCYGAEVPFLRPEEFARDDSPDSEFVLHAIDWLMKNEGGLPDYIVHLRPTTPLRDPEIIDFAITEMEKQAQATSLRSGHLASESPFKWFLRNQNGFFSGITQAYSNDQINMARHLFPEVYIPDGYVDILKVSFINQHKAIHGDLIYGFISPVCQEVDTLEDFEYLEFLVKNKPFFIHEYLEKHYKAKV